MQENDLSAADQTVKKTLPAEAVTDITTKKEIIIPELSLHFKMIADLVLKGKGVPSALYPPCTRPS